MNVTILGGTGVMGRMLARPLIERGHQLTITGRSIAADPGPGVLGVSADLATGAGIPDAISSADTVIHLASSPSQPMAIDVEGTRRLLDLLGDRHLVYLSVVGVDRHPLPYYQAKHATERVIEERAGIYTIVRATQWHDFIAMRVDRMTRGLVARVPRGYVYQPIDRLDVAHAIVDLVETRPQGRGPDLAGPEVLGIEHLARTYMAARGGRRPLLRIPKFGPVAKAYRNGLHTNPGRAMGRITWAQYLARRFADS